ncbi:hypothetical protein [Candidatus Enterococcus ferrettii]|uniref:Uncharacterized protein n=1 Tax=Candidatus Enterococcus ferrettii TaxID=2815324 RepID=A0ABV0F057_9ENTE|nr:hypothetical protein [Enterococcus sp. 665A]MBO1341411.1 hypothetical protein [Enterococcus sp. 665A]
MGETKHNVAERTCANCAYWEGQRLMDKASGISFINPNEVAECGNSQSPDVGKNVTPSHSCAFWKDAV